MSDYFLFRLKLNYGIRNSLTLSIFMSKLIKQKKTTQSLKTLQFMKETVILSQLRNEAGNFNVRLFK